MKDSEINKSAVCGWVADAELLANDINECDWVYFDKDNKVMQQAFEKHGFKHCGVIYLLNGEPREAYQLVV